MKQHLTKVVGVHLRGGDGTLLAQVDDCLRFRPLVSISLDPDDLDALKPAHFLTGENIFELHDENTEGNLNRKW